MRLNCVDYGGIGTPPVLFIHGGAAHARWWDFAAQKLAGSHRAFSIDLPRNGDSDRPPDGITASSASGGSGAGLARMGLRQAGPGGTLGRLLVALPYAVRHPESVAAMVIVEPRIHWPPRN